MTHRIALAMCVSLAACAADAEQDVLLNADRRAAAAASADGCNIMLPACQSDVLAMVAAARGRPVPAPPQYVFRSFAEADKTNELIVAEDASDADRRERWDAAYSALALLPPVHSSRYAAAHQRDAQLNMAYYSAATRAILLTAPAAVLPRDARSEMGVLAHELTHYMQDLELGLERVSQGAQDDADAQSAVRAFVEGEASYVGWTIESSLRGVTSTAADWSAYFDELDSSYLARISSSRAPLATALDVMPYSIGARRIAELWLGSGRAAVDALSENIPGSFAQWMRHDAAPSSRDIACAAPAAPNGYVLLDQTRLGALGALAFLSAGAAADLEVVAPLRADTMFLYAPLPSDKSNVAQVYANQQPNVVAAWLLRFASEAEAHAFELAIPPPTSSARTFTRKKTVVALAVSTDPTQPAAAPLKMLDCQ